MGYIRTLYDAAMGKKPIKEELKEPKSDVKRNSVPTDLPKGRRSQPDNVYGFANTKKTLSIVTPSFVRSSIPLIRKLYKVNPDLGIALFDIVQLTNTGYEITFDKDVKPELANKMRKHISDVSKEWNYGTPGLSGIINKMITQIYVSGALSNEWVPKSNLKGIETVIFVNPESIEFALDRRGLHYKPYQRVKNSSKLLKSNGLIKLNTDTYKYFGLFSDEDEPYGVPPFLTSLEDIDTQLFMKKNIRHIVKQVGIMGFIELLMDKPVQEADESVGAYTTRLNNTLEKAKLNMMNGVNDGVLVGYHDDHEFKFHTTTKGMQGMAEVVQLTETQVANGLKTSSSFIGAGTGGTETMISIIFTKMLSQLTNVQNVISHNLEYGIKLELMMAGFKFKDIKVGFKASTIQDDLKIQQGLEIKLRNLTAKYNQGIINNDQFAYEAGYDKPDKQEPRQQAGDVLGDAKKKEDREGDKDKSDKKVRDKNKPQPKNK